MCGVTIRAIKKVFSFLIQSSYWDRFRHGCPAYLCVIKDLSFLPHALQANVRWRESELVHVQELHKITDQQWHAHINGAILIRQMFPGGNDLGHFILNFRISQKTDVPSRLKKLFSWILSSWKKPKAPSHDFKMRKIEKLLKQGPALLQETDPETLSHFLSGTK